MPRFYFFYALTVIFTVATPGWAEVKLERNNDGRSFRLLINEPENPPVTISVEREGLSFIAFQTEFLSNSEVVVAAQAKASDLTTRPFVTAENNRSNVALALMFFHPRSGQLLNEHYLGIDSPGKEADRIIIQSVSQESKDNFVVSYLAYFVDRVAEDHTIRPVYKPFDYEEEVKVKAPPRTVTKMQFIGAFNREKETLKKFPLRDMDLNGGCISEDGSYIASGMSSNPMGKGTFVLRVMPKELKHMKIRFYGEALAKKFGGQAHLLYHPKALTKSQIVLEGRWLNPKTTWQYFSAVVDSDLSSDLEIGPQRLIAPQANKPRRVPIPE